MIPKPSLPTPQFVEKLSSTKLPGAQKLLGNADHMSMKTTYQNRLNSEAMRI